MPILEKQGVHPGPAHKESVNFTVLLRYITVKSRL